MQQPYMQQPQQPPQQYPLPYGWKVALPEVESKPTWSLAWGLYWRMLLIHLMVLLMCGTGYGIILLISQQCA